MQLRSVLLIAALAVGSVPRIDAVSRIFTKDRDQRSDVRQYYVSVADSVLAGRGFIPSYPTNFIPPPGQALFILVLKWIWPAADYQHMRSVQALVSIATLAVAAAVAARLGGPWAGVVCAWLLALSYRHAAWVGILLPETNYVFLLFAFTWALVDGLERAEPRRLLGAGALLGAASLFRPLPALLAVVLAVLVLFQRGTARSRLAIALLAGELLVVSPWLARNRLHYGTFLPISTNGGTLLALANSPALDSAQDKMVFWDDLYSQSYYRDPEIEARFAGARDVDGKPEENLKDRAYLGKALGYAVSQPFHFLRNYAFKLGHFLRQPERAGIGTGETAPWLFREAKSLTLAVVIVGLLGVGHLATMRRQEPAASAVVTTVLYLWAVGALYHLTRDGRMDTPFKLLLSIPASVGIVETLSAAARRYKLLLSTGARDSAA